jgi:hypothetical protein
VRELVWDLVMALLRVASTDVVFCVKEGMHLELLMISQLAEYNNFG